MSRLSRCLRRAADVTLESADLRQRNDLTMRWRLDSTRFRRVFVESQVRARGVIVAEVIAKTMSQVSLVGAEAVAEELRPDGTDHPPGEGFLPGRAGGGGN